MARWKLLRRDPAAPAAEFVLTGEVYDDANVAVAGDAPWPSCIADYLVLRKSEDGWDYKAEPA